jgi:hypothetical protein
MYEDIAAYFEIILSKHQYGFRKGYSAQQCLIAMTEKWRKALDLKGCFGALLTDLSKAFDCIPHALLIAKLDAYGFSPNSLMFMSSYLINRKQRVRINEEFSCYTDMLYGVPQGSILGPLLFNIFICDLFLFLPDVDIAGYADDNTPYCAKKDITSVIHELQKTANKLLEWFENNGMKANPEKYCLIVSKQSNLEVTVSNLTIQTFENVKLLGININNKLSFEEHVNSLCKYASRKVNALSRIASYMSFNQRKLILSAFITSNFSYCPLVWMFHSRKLNKRINRIHERALRIIYRDYESPFEILLLNSGALTIHQKNLHCLVTEIFKVKLNIAPISMNDVFKFLETNLRHEKPNSTNIRTTKYGLESLSYLGPKIWKLVPDDCKISKSLKEFKFKIKNWIPKQCPCKLCMVFIKNVGYIN